MQIFLEEGGGKDGFYQPLWNIDYKGFVARNEGIESQKIKAISNPHRYSMAVFGVCAPQFISTSGCKTTTSLFINSGYCQTGTSGLEQFDLQFNPLQ